MKVLTGKMIDAALKAHREKLEREARRDEDARWREMYEIMKVKEPARDKRGRWLPV